MSLRSLARVFLALLALSAAARAEDKVAKETLESRGEKRVYHRANVGLDIRRPFPY